VIMWFGLGIAPKIILASMFVFFIVFMNALAGIGNVNADHVRIVRVMGASRLAVMRKVVFPTMTPFLILGLRVSIPEAMTGAVIGEFISANSGLGYLVYSASITQHRRITGGADRAGVRGCRGGLFAWTARTATAVAANAERNRADRLAAAIARPGAMR
jgi:ABC-type proline/glycine betaine transport system permease subunit